MKAKGTLASRGLLFLPLFFLFMLQSLGSYSQTITIDGNPSDWPAALNAAAIPVKEFVRDANNTNDNQFTGGASDGDLITGWQWVLGNTNDKGDISNAGAVLIGTKIYFFGDRTAINGDAQIGFWFFLGGVAPSGTGLSNSPFSGTHVVGDILVLSHFTNGGGVVQLEIYEWNGSGITHLGTTSNASVNAADFAVPAYNDHIYGPWTYTPKTGTGYVTGSFFEGYFDIGTLSSNVCFSSFLLETRNSQSVNASLQDFVAGAFNLKPLPPVATADSRCGPGTLNLSATGVGTLKWYSDVALATQVATGSSFSPSLSATHTYYVTATNDQGCVSDASPVVATINELPLASSTPKHVTCFSGANGEVTITFSGGTGPYMVSFNGGGFVSETSPKTYNGLSAGTYSWIVQDSKLCIQPGSETINQPDELGLVLTPSNATCYGGNMSISAAVSGTPMADLEINIDGGAFAAVAASPVVFNALGEGSHTVIVRRASDNSCLVSKSVSVSQPDELGLVLTPSNATCYGGNMSISAAVSGTPLADFEINIDGGAFAAVAASPVVFNALGEGNHTVILRRVSDNSCLVSKSVSVSQPDELGLVLTPSNATCYGGNMSISAAVSGTPMADLEINIDGGAFAAVAASPVVFNALGEGSHTVIVRRVSDNSCLVSKSVSVSQPDELGLVLTPSKATCYGGNMFISAAVSGTPLADLEINIDGGAFAAVAASPVVFNALGEGSHTVILRRVSDNSCLVSKSVSVSQPDELGLVLTPSNATCYGGNMSISAAVSGTPMADLEINIDGGAFAAVAASPVVFNALGEGSHTVILRRASDNSCLVSKSVSVSQPDELGLVLTPSNATCYGGNMSISAAVSGTPMADLEINIDGGAFAAVAASPVVFNALGEGSHTVIVRRASDNSCLVSKSVSVSQPDELGLVLTPSNATCYGGNMSISAAVSGTPLADFEINIDGGAFAAVAASPVVFNALGEGNHTVIVRRVSDNSCLVSKSVSVSQPDELGLVLTPSNATCYGGNMSISAAVSGTPLADLEINIDGGAFAAVAASPVVFNALGEGSHTVILRRVSDNSCLVSKSVSVSQPDELGLVLTPSNATCYGGNMSISAAVSGTPLADFEINIDGGAFAAVAASPVVFNALGEGNHTVILRRVSDNSCLVSKSVSVSQPDELGLVLTPSNATCYGGNMSISAAVSGTPMADLEINIDGGAFAAVAASPVVFNALGEGSHTVIVRRVSDNSCLVSKSVSVSQPDELGLVILQAGIDPCLGGTTGSVTVGVTGSPLSDLEISVDGDPFGPVTDNVMVFTGLGSGGHIVVLRRISDNSCQATSEPRLVVPEPLNCSILFNSEAGCDNTGGSATVTATGGSGFYLFVWDNGETGPTAVNLSSGLHTVTATDENNCTTTCSVEITRAECGEVFCTYTQGYFGNPQGKSCDGINGSLSTSQLIENSLTAWGGTLVVGKPGASVYMNNNASDILCIISRLPGGSGSRELDKFDYAICNISASYLKKGKINNVLLAQTITLGLNIGIKSNLASLPLQGGVLVTARVDGGCGGTEPVERVCLYDVDGNLTGVQNDYKYISLDPAVINAIGGNKTVSDLFDLANRALANTDLVIGKEDGVSLSAINSAVDAVNNAFDGCRFLIGFDVPMCPAHKSGQLVPENQLAEAMSMKVYPNPFQDRLTFEFTSETAAHATLEVYNILGEKISILMNRMVEGAITNRIEYQPVNLAPGVIYYRLILDGKTQIGKAIYNKAY